jgi:plasmid stabilization system protein ParE
VSPAFIVLPDAESDLNQAYHWYEEKRQGLGEDFFLSVDAAFASIHRQPESYQKVYKQARKSLIRRFPYVVLYTFENDIIAIIGVFHVKRNPKAWQSRTSGLQTTWTAPVIT